LRGMPSTTLRVEALAIWAEAKGLATDIPPNTGDKDEMRSEHFEQVLHRFDEMRWKIENRFYANLDFFVSAIEGELRTHEKSELDGQESGRGRAVLAEAQALVARYAKASKQQELAMVRLNGNPTYKRLSDEKDRLQEEAELLSNEIGMNGYASDVACATRTA